MERKTRLEDISEESGGETTTSGSEDTISDGETEFEDGDQSSQSVQQSDDLVSVPSVLDIPSVPDKSSSDAEGESESSEDYEERGSGDHIEPPVRFSVQLRNRAEEVQRKSLCSLQRSLVMCHEMDAFAKHTLVKLNAGAKTFQLMEDQQAEIEKDLLETTESMERMAKCCGECVRGGERGTLSKTHATVSVGNRKW